MDEIDTKGRILGSLCGFLTGGFAAILVVFLGCTWFFLALCAANGACAAWSIGVLIALLGVVALTAWLRDLPRQELVDRNVIGIHAMRQGRFK